MYVHVRVSLYLHAAGCVCVKDQRRRDQGSSGCLLLIMAGFFFFSPFSNNYCEFVLIIDRKCALVSHRC